MSLAIFDLDNTLLGGDSDYLWGRFLVEQGHVDGDHYDRENRRFYDEYNAGTLDIFEFLRFSLKPLAEHDMVTLKQWHRQFMYEKIAPIMRPKAADLEAALRAHYAGAALVSVLATTSDPAKGRLEAESLNGTDRLELRVYANETHRQAVLVAKLDNLGKGASGAAVQNLKLMLGID